MERRPSPRPCAAAWARCLRTDGGEAEVAVEAVVDDDPGRLRAGARPRRHRGRDGPRRHALARLGDHRARHRPARGTSDHAARRGPGAARRPRRRVRGAERHRQDHADPHAWHAVLATSPTRRCSWGSTAPSLRTPSRFPSSWQGVRGKEQVSPDADSLLPVPPVPLRLASVVLLNRVPDVGPQPVVEDVELLAGIAELAAQVSYLPRVPNPLQSLARLLEDTGGLTRVTYSEADTLVDVVPLLAGARGDDRARRRSDDDGGRRAVSRRPRAGAGGVRGDVALARELGDRHGCAPGGCRAWGARRAPCWRSLDRLPIGRSVEFQTDLLVRQLADVGVVKVTSVHERFKRASPYTERGERSEGHVMAENSSGVGVSRRRIIQGAAWATPAVLIATAAPSAAASPPKLGGLALVGVSAAMNATSLFVHARLAYVGDGAPSPDFPVSAVRLEITVPTIPGWRRHANGVRNGLELLDVVHLGTPTPSSRSCGAVRISRPSASPTTELVATIPKAASVVALSVTLTGRGTSNAVAVPPVTQTVTAGLPGNSAGKQRRHHLQRELQQRHRQRSGVSHVRRAAVWGSLLAGRLADLVDSGSHSDFQHKSDGRRLPAVRGRYRSGLERGWRAREFRWQLDLHLRVLRHVEHVPPPTPRVLRSPSRRLAHRSLAPLR